MAAAAQPAAVGAGTLFATLQSAGAGGYGVPIVYGAVQGGMAALGTTIAGVNTWWAKKRGTGEGEKDDNQPEETKEQISEYAVNLSREEKEGPQEETLTANEVTIEKAKGKSSKL